MKTRLIKLFFDDDGPTAVEYAVMVAMIVVACLGSIYTLSNQTAASLDYSAGELSSVLGS